MAGFKNIYTYIYIFYSPSFMTMWKNVTERSKPQMTIWYMRILCWLPRAKITHSGCAILIVFPFQQWLHERVSMLRYAFFVLFVISRSILLRMRNVSDKS